MKKLAIVFGLALLVAVPSWAAGLGVGVAYWDTKDAADDEGISLRLGIGMADSPVEVDLRVAFFGELAQVANNALFRLEATPVDFGLSYHFNQGAKARPYLGGGGSFVFSNAVFDGGQVPLAGGPEVDDEFGFYVVGGVDVGLNERFGFFGEVLYRQVKFIVTGNDFDFTDFRSDFSGVGVTGGVMLRW